MAEENLGPDETLYCLGDIVHNDMEVKRLKEKGLRFIDHDDLEQMEGEKVLIRAHGEPPETYETALENNIELIDASCPVVLKLQNRVKTAFNKSKEDDGQVVIYGKPGHAETKGLLGQTNQEAIIVTGLDDLDKIDYSRPIYLFSQTTKNLDFYYKLKDIIVERAEEHGNEEVNFNDSICRQVSNRGPEMREFAREHDVIVFVSGKKSSNGKVLYNTCKEENDQSYFVIQPSDVKADWFEGAETVGVCGATSTPAWLMKDVADHIRENYKAPAHV
jgi:4-hydroxy-3-methylbut-2-enyl diphosphate reductase